MPRAGTADRHRRRIELTQAIDNYIRERTIAHADALAIAAEVYLRENADPRLGACGQGHPTLGYAVGYVAEKRTPNEADGHAFAGSCCQHPGCYARLGAPSAMQPCPVPGTVQVFTWLGGNTTIGSAWAGDAEWLAARGAEWLAAREAALHQDTSKSV